MSRWPTEFAAAARLHALGARAARAWAGARGRTPRHVAYLRGQGVASWPSAGGSAQAESFDTFAAWCAAHPGADVRACVSGQATHGLVVDAGLALSGVAALHGYARQQFTHYHGPQAASWPLAVWEGGVCGLHGVDLAALRADAAAHEVRLRSLAPAWSAGLAGLAGRHPGFGGAGRQALLLVEGGAATWIVLQDGAIATLRQRWLDAPRGEAVVRLLEALLRDGESLASPPLVAGWGLDTPAALPAELATACGDLAGDGAMAGWMLGRP